jgi:hypothetical protein
VRNARTLIEVFPDGSMEDEEMADDVEGDVEEEEVAS